MQIQRLSGGLPSYTIASRKATSVRLSYDLRAAWGNPVIKKIIERAVLDGNFKDSKEEGKSFLSKINDLCNSKLSSDEIYSELRNFFCKLFGNRKIEEVFKDDQNNRVKKRVIQVTEFLNDFLPTSYLDVGYGDGEITNTLVKSFNLPLSKAFGVEVVTKQNVHNSFQPIYFDGYNIPLPDNSQDLITLLSTLHHVEDLEALIRDIYRVSSPNGHILVRDFDASTEELKIFNLVMDHIYYKVYNVIPEVPIPANYLSKDEWIEIFNVNGFITNKLSYPEPNNPYNPFLLDLSKSTRE